MDLKKLIKELDDEYFYLALYVGDKRIYGDFCYNRDTTLKEYLKCEVLDITPSETSNIVKVILKECETKEELPTIEKEEETSDGKKRRKSTTRKGTKIS